MCMCALAYPRTRVSVYVCTSVDVYVWTCTYAYTSVITYARTYVRVRVYMYARICYAFLSRDDDTPNSQLNQIYSVDWTGLDVLPHTQH